MQYKKSMEEKNQKKTQNKTTIGLVEKEKNSTMLP